MGQALQNLQSDVLCSVENDFDFLSDEYRALFATSSATVFQSPFWLASFYSTLSPALDLQPHIVTIRMNDGTLGMVLPCVKQFVVGVKVLQPADMGVSDYNAYVATNEMVEMLKEDQQLRRELASVLGKYDVFFFRKQRCDSPQIQDVLDFGKRSANDFSSYEVHTGEDFDEWYNAHFSKKFKKHNRRRSNILERDYGGMSLEIAKDKTEITEALDFIRRERGKRYEDDLLNLDAYFDFYTHIALNYAESGEVVTAIGYVDGEIAMAELGVVHQDRFCALLAAFESEKYSKYSLGTMGTLETMRKMQELGCPHYDFSLGDESYKERFGTEEVQIDNVVFSKSAAGTLLSYTYAKAKPVKNLLKRFAPALK